MKRLIIADVKSRNDKGKSFGHYVPVAHNYLDLYKEYCNIKIAGGPIYKSSFNNNEYFSLPYDFVPGLNWVRNKWRVLMNCRYLFKHTLKEDIIIIQESALVTAILGIALFAKNKRNIYLISYDTDAVSSFFKRIIYNCAKFKIKGILCPNKYVADAYKLPNCIIPDYIYTKNFINASVQIQNKKYDIAIIGGIVPDKGVVEAAKYLAKKTNYKILIAGRADEQTARELNNICILSQNIELRIGFVSADDYCTYIRSARYCMLNYQGCYKDRSSGVVLDIIFNGTPIIGHRCKALNFIENENIGYLFDHLDDIDWSILNDPQRYTTYLQGISNYLVKQKIYKKNVIEFLGIGI